MNVLLRKLKIEDADISYKWRNDREIWNYTENQPDKVITLDDERNWIKKILSREMDIRMAICVEKSNTYVGNIYLIQLSESIYEYHIFIGDKDYWSKGIAYNASIQLFEKFLPALGNIKVVLKVHVDNKPAIKLYNALGFQRTKTESQNNFISMELTGYEG